MSNNDFIHEPDDMEIDMMLKYVPAYSADNARNIKDKFTQKAKTKQKRHSFRKPVLIGAAASMVFVTTLVYANVINMGEVYRIVFGVKYEYVSPYILKIDVGPITDEAPAQRNEILTTDNGASAPDNADGALPVKEAASPQSEYDGIVIKLISAIYDENVLRIFAAVTDTTGDRLGESIDFTSWVLSQGDGGGISVIDYNHETKTATIMLTSLGSDHQGSASLTVNGLTVGRELLVDLPESNIDAVELLKRTAPVTVSQDDVWLRGGSARNDSSNELFKKSRLLESDELNIPFDNAAMFSISNIGFVDGRLHIQTKAALSGTALVHGYFINIKFLNAAKETVYEPAAWINFVADGKYAYAEYAGEPHDEYSEMIYDDITSPEQLNGLTVAIDCMKSPKIIEGHWEFAFTVPEKVTTEFYINREIPINGEKMKIGMISLSPLGITIHLPQGKLAGHNPYQYRHDDAVYVEYKDGTVIELNESSIHTTENESTLFFGGDIIEIEKVQSLIINGERIDVSQ